MNEPRPGTSLARSTNSRSMYTHPRGVIQIIVVVGLAVGGRLFYARTHVMTLGQGIEQTEEVLSHECELMKPPVFSG